jgi:hypothetical protein
MAQGPQHRELHARFAAIGGQPQRVIYVHHGLPRGSVHQSEWPPALVVCQVECIEVPEPVLYPRAAMAQTCAPTCKRRVS